MKFVSKKFVSIFLIVSMIFVNNGFSVLASSIETVVVENQNNIEEGVKLYYEESEETVVVDITESEEMVTNIAEDEEENSETNNGVVELAENIDDILEIEPEEETNDTNEISNTNEMSENEEPEEETEIATESEFEEETEIILETELEEGTEISTESETELRIELEEETEVATESELEEEIRISTESELIEHEVATESEIATESEFKKEIVVATVSKITWKVIKIFIATHSSARINTDRKDEKIEARLATQANVLIENNFGDQKIVKVDLNWKLEKKFEINARTTEKKDAVKPEVWKEKLGADKFIEEKNKEKVVMTATSNIADIEEEVKKENENFDDKEIVVVVEIEKNEESEIEEIPEADKRNEEEIIETQEIERNIDTKEIDDIKTIEETEETDGVKIIDEIEVADETVEGFSGTEGTFSEVTESETNDDDNITEIEKEKSKTVATVNIADYENESGIVGKDSINDISLAHYDVQSIEFWSIDMDKLGESLLDSIKTENKNENEEEIGDKQDTKGIVDSIINSINNFFAGEEKNDNEVVEEEKTAETVARNFSLTKMVQAVAPAAVENPMVEITQFRTTPSAEHTYPTHDIYNSILSGYSEKVSEGDFTNNSEWGDIDGIDQSQVGTGSQIKVQGKFYLTRNYTIDKLWTVPDDASLYICLNGFNLIFDVSAGDPMSGGSEGAIERYLNNDGSFGTTGNVYICNCSTNVSHIYAMPPVYGMTDKFYASTSEVYTKYKEKPLISAPNVYVFGKNQNISFDNNKIKNRYTGFNARNMMLIPEEDFPFNGGGGSILNATVDMKVVGVKFENNIATRTNGVAINSMNGKLLVEKSYFKNNINNSSKGGAIALNPMNSEIYDSTFEENVSETVGGAIYGKAFLSANQGTGTKIQKTIFKNNKAYLDGGAIYFDDIGPGKEITIGGTDLESQKCTFVGNISGTKGGAIAFKNVVEEKYGADKSISLAYNPPNEGKLTINNCEFDGNICKNLTNNDTQLDNKGGAISLDNYDISKRILKTVEIKNTLFKNNKAEGKELEIHKYDNTGAIIGETGYKLTLQSYGGAIFASGFDDNDHKIKLEKVEMDKNEATSGANLCLNKAIVELKECNIHDNEFTKAYFGGSAIDLTDTKKLADLSITPGGGAAYLMNGAKLIVDKDTTIINNRNALYLDNADIEVAGGSINNNIGEYIIGANNKTANTVTFDTVDIKDNGGHTVGGSGWEADGRIINRKKDYYDDSAAKLETDPTKRHEVLTKVLFKGDFLTINNNERKYSNQIGLPLGTAYTYDKSEECNIDIRSTLSNLQLDLSQYRFTISEDRIGLHYDIENDLSYNGTYAYTTWNPTMVAGYNYGDLWHTLFTLDNSDDGEPLEKWGYIKDDTNLERILLVSGITRIHFNSYIEGARQIASQFYQIKAAEGSSEIIKISTPTELQNAAYNTGGKTVLGFVGKHNRYQQDWDPWDFNVDEITIEAGEEDVEFIVIYADSQIKIKSCGLPNDVPCNHPDGSIHAPRGGVDAHEEAARYSNYVLVATYAQLSYKYKSGDPAGPRYNKRTQYMLDKDIFFDAALAQKYIHGDIILNLNGKTLNVDCSGTTTPIFKASNSILPGIAIPDGSTHIVIAGRATTANIENGKIVFTNSENVSAPLIDTNGKSIYMTDVQIDGYTGVNTSLIQSNVNLNSSEDNEIVIESCDIKNIETIGPIDGDINTITGAHNIYFSNSRFTNIKNENGLFVKPIVNEGSAEKIPLFEISKSTISYFEGKSIFLTPKTTDTINPLNISLQKGMKIVIASSSIDNSKFNDNGIELTTKEFSDKSKSKLVLRGNNLFKANECDNVGKSIITTDYNYIFDDVKGETIFDGNKSRTSIATEGYIMKMSDTSTPSLLNGGLVFRNNRNIAEDGSDKLSAALYFDSDSAGGIAKIRIGNGYLYADGNENKYNIYVNNNQLTKDTEIFVSDNNTKLDVTKSKINIGLATNEYEQLIYKDYKPETIIGDARIEKLFTRSGVTQPIYNTYRKANANDNIDVYFGKEYVTGRFKLYDYSSVAKDERDNSIPYDADIYDNYEHRVASGSLIKLDKVDVSTEEDEIYWSKGLYVDNPTDVSNEYVIHKNTDIIRVNENKNFIISGYRSKAVRHIHSNTGNQDWWLEARNEAHLQPCTESYIFLHNDITITHSLFDNANSKLDNEYRICLNGHKLILAGDIDWLTTTENVNVEICDCGGLGSIEQNRTTLPKYHKEFINMSNGKLNLQDIKVLNFDVLSNGVDKAGLINISPSAYNAAGEFGIKNVEFNGNKVEFVESDPVGSFIHASNFATQSILSTKFKNNTLITKEKEQYFLRNSIDNTVDKSQIIDELELDTNSIEGQGSFVRFEDYKNYVFKNIVVNNNTVYSGSPLSVKGRGTTITELGFTNATFEANKKKAKAEFTIASPNSANVELAGIKKLTVDTGSFKNAVYDTGAVLNAATVSTVLHVDEDTEVYMYNVTFDGNNYVNPTTAKSSKAFYFNGNKDITFENCTFKGGNAESSDLIEIGENYSGNIKFTGTTNFNNVKARYIINVKAQNAVLELKNTVVNGSNAERVINLEKNGAKLTLDGVNANNNIVTNSKEFVYVGNGAIVLSSGSNIINTNGRVFNIDSDDVTLYNTVIQSNNSNVGPAIDLGGNLKLGDKVVIKGYQRNLRFLTTGKIIADTAHKLVDGSEIYITGNVDNHNFFDGWGANYIEDYGKHNPISMDINDWSYLPERIFKVDNTNNIIYKEGTNIDRKLYICNKTSDKYITLKFVDESERPDLGYSIYQYVAASPSGATSIDVIQVGYLSTSSQAWKHYFNQTGTGIGSEALWRVKDGMINANDVESGEYIIKLAKIHIHYECGVFLNTECHHVDGIVHSTEEEYYEIYSPDKIASAPDATNAFGIKNDMTLAQADIDEMVSRAGVKDTIYICLEGNKLTLADNAKFGSAKNLVITNCEGETYITVATESYIDYPIINTGSHGLKIYRTKIKNIKATANNTIFSVTGNVVIENSSIENCESDSENGLIDVPSSAQINNATLSENTINDNAAHNSILYDASQEYIKLNNFNIVNNTYATKLVKVTTSKFGNVNVKNNKIIVSTDSTINHYGALTIENGNVEIYDSIIEENDASKAANSIGGGITLLSGNIEFKKDVNIIGNKAVKGGAIYTDNYSTHKFTFGGTSTQSVLIKSNEADEGGALYVPNATGLAFIKNTTFQENKGKTSGVIYYTGDLVLPDGIAFRKNSGKDLIYNETSGGSLTVNDIVLTGNGLAGAAFRAKGLTNVNLNNVHRLTTNTFGSLLSAENCTNVNINNMAVGGSSFTDAAIVVKDNANGVNISSSSFIGNTITNGAISLDNTILKIQDNNLKVYDNIGPSNKNRDIYIVGGTAYVAPQTMLATTSRMGFSSKEDGVLVFKGWDNGHIQGYNIPIEGRDYAFTPETSYELYASNDATLKGYELYKGETLGDVYIGSNDKFAKITFMDEDLTSTYTTQNIKKSSGSDVYTVRLNAVNTFECDISKQEWQIPKADGTYYVVNDFNSSNADIVATTNLIAKYIKPHLHKDCGVVKDEACVHEGTGNIHTAADERTYKAVTSIEDIIDKINNGIMYLYLLNDIVATRSTTLPNGVIGICLNGFSFICSSDSEAIFSVTAGGMTSSNQLTITNCKDHGGFELEDGETVRQHEFLKTTGSLSGGGTLKVYNVTIGKETKHIKASNSLIYNEKGNVYTENLKLQYIDSVGDKGLLLTEGDKSYHHKLSVYGCNVDNLIVADNKTEFGDIELKRNIVKNLIKVEGNDVKAKSINIINNIVNNVGISIDSGNKLEVTNTFDAKSNNVGTAGKNLVYVNAGTFKVASVSTFNDNQTENGAIIQVIDGSTGSLDLYKPIFENNRPGISDETDAAVIAWDKELSLTDAVFKNHTTTRPLIRNYKKTVSDNRDKLTLINSTYINNTGIADAIYIDNLDTGSLINGFDKANITSNNFKNLVNVSSGSLILKNIDIDGGNYAESVIKANNMDDITFASASILNTNSSNYAVNITNTKVGLEEKIEVSGNTKNIRLNDDAYFFMNGTNKLTKDSKLYIDVEKGNKVFDGWTVDHVEAYRDLAYDAENPIHLYTPESSGIFNFDQDASTFKAYKKGTGSDVSVYAGKENEDYVVLKFKQEADPDPIECIDEYDFGTQNVAKGEATQLDVVDSFEYEEYKQLWKAPDVGSIGHTETWCFMEPGGTAYYDVVSTYSEAKTISYYIRHIHRECGSKLNETCSHEYTYAGHDTTYEYLVATNSESFKDLLNAAGAQIALKKDINIEITNGSSEYNFANLNRLCLNGRKLTIKVVGTDNYSSPIFTTASHELSICDCKRRKGYEGAISITNEGSIHLTNSLIQVSSQNAYITDVSFDGISIGAAAGGTLITTSGSGKAYVEKAKVKNSTYIGSTDGLFVSNNAGGLNLYDAEFSHNFAGGTSNPMLKLTGNINITTLSIIDNYRSNGDGTDTKVLVDGNVSLSTLYVNGNKTNSSAIIEIPSGASLTLTKESIFENNQGGEGGVMNIKGILTADKDVIFRENQAGSGGSIYISDDGKVIGLGTISFIRNKANQTGAAIYAKNTKENTFNFAKVIFDGNTKGNQPTVNSVVEADGGILKLVNPIFVNHGTEVKSIIRNIRPNSTIKIENPTFINNRTDNDAFYFEQIASNSEIIGLDKNNIIGNKFKNFINMYGTYKKTGEGIVLSQDINLLTISGSLENGEYIDSVITVKNTYDPGIPTDLSREELVSHVTFASLSVIGNTISSGNAAVLLSGDKNSTISTEPVRSGRVAIKGRVVIDGNINSKNLYIENANSFLQGIGAYIDPESHIDIKVYEADIPVFKGWNGANFENYDHPDNTLSPLTYTFTPENSGIFKSADETFAIYKVGDTDEDVYIGNDYVTLTWKNDFENDPDEEIITYCTQNVKKGANVKIDTVDSFEYELYKQEWYDPTHDPRDKSFSWAFADSSSHTLVPLTKTFSEDTIIWYIQKHIHKECGQKLLNPCEHMSPVSAHAETVEYVINDGYGVNDVRQITMFTGEHLMLRGDITVTETINLPSNLKGICLNGKTIKSDGVTGNFFNVGSGTLKICNCKNKGGIRVSDQLIHNGDIFNVSGTASVETYNINYGYDPMDVPEGSEHETTKLSGSIMNITGSANGYIERGKVSGFTMVGTEGLFNNTGSGNLILTDFNFIRNEINVTNDPLLKLDTKITLGTISIIENIVNGPVVEIDGTVGLVSINANNNRSINSAVISIPAGSILNLSGDTVISNDSGSKGGALYVAGTFNAGANILFENNTAISGNSVEKLYGGAVFVDDGGKFNVSGTAKFTNNNAKYGSSIYAYKAATDTFNINHAEFVDEKNEEGGVIGWSGILKLASISFISNHSGTGALIENDVNDYIIGSLYTGVVNLDITDVYMSDNTTEKDAIKVSAIDEVKITNLHTDNAFGINKFDNVTNIVSTNDPSTQNILITNADLNNTNYKNAGIYLSDGVNAFINNIKLNENAGTNYGAILVKGADTKLLLNGDVFINNNTSSGNYGAAITILDKANVDVSVAATGDHFDISGNKSNGGAVYVDGKLGMEGKLIINGNTNNANLARNIYIANADSYTYGRGGAIPADSRLGYTGFDNNTLVFKGWTTSIIPGKNNPVTGYCYTPENSGMFIKDQDAISSGKEFYKSGVMNNCSVKLGKEFVKLSFVTPNKLTTYCTQNIEKNVETELDKVTTLDSYGNYVTWVAPGINSQATENWVFESETYDAKYDSNKDIVKSYIYSVVFTGGTHSAEYPNDERIVRYGDSVAMPYWTTVIPGATFRAWKIRNPLQGMNPTLYEGDNVSNLSLTENGIAYVDAAFVGEYYVKFIPNLETIGLDPESVNAIDVISHGETVSLGAKFGNQGSYRLASYNTKSDGTGTTYSIGSSVTPTDDINLYAQWTAVQPSPTPDPHRGGGGGGGGGGVNHNSDGTIINGIYIPNGIDPLHPQIEHRFILREDGSIVDEAGNVVGNTNVGDVLNEDGSFTAVNGITRYPDGRLKDQNGYIFNTDGSITLPDGNTYYTDGRMKDGYGNMIYPDGKVEFIDGTVKDAAGILHHPDGSITTVDGIRYYLDGRVVLPDGREITKDNILTGTTQGDTIGNFVFDVKTNKYKFVSKDKTGNNMELSDQWILKTDQSGKQKWFIVNHDGNMSTGWVKKDGEYYYMSKEVANLGELVVGRQTINGKSYEFDSDGKLINGVVPMGEIDVIGATNHKLGVDGDWILDNDGIRKFMTKFVMMDGSVLDIPPSGWYMIDGSYYFFDISGKPLTGLIISDGKYYFMQDDGKMKEGGEVIIDNIKYTFDKATGACRTFTAV